MYIFLQAYRFFSVVIQDFLSFVYCDALKDGLARTVKVFRNGARTSLLLSTGVPSMQTWPIIRNERHFQLLHCFWVLVVCLAYKYFKGHHEPQQQFKRSLPCSKTNKECMGIWPSNLLLRVTPMSTVLLLTINHYQRMRHHFCLIANCLQLGIHQLIIYFKLQVYLELG